MPCLAIRRWTFSGLVGAFLDLSITFIFLCASALAYFASKFLALFGLYLPCPCNGYFSIPDANNNCLQRQLLDYPLQRISSIQASVKSKFPFDSIGNRSQWKSNLENYRNVVKNEISGCEGDSSSCISSSDRRAGNSTDGDLEKIKGKGFVMGAMHLQNVKDKKFDGKWKGLPRRRSRNNLRSRRRKGAVDNGKLSHVSSNKSLWSDAETPQSAPDRIRNETRNGGNDPPCCRDEKEGSVVDIGSKRKISQGFEVYESVDENEVTDQENNGSDVDGNARNTIKLLELALEEEHAARAVLYIELEKERNAAATAADEAMGMILRLQKEKAAIEMEARQSQRMIEEKYAYDAEEMNILKEILLRREREKYFLEKEVEAYRQTICNEQFDSDNLYGFCYSSDDELALTLPQKSCDSISKKYKAEKETMVTKLSEDDNSSTHGDITGHGNQVSDEEYIQQKSSLQLIQSATSLPHNFVDKAGSYERVIHDVHVIDDQSKQVTGDKNKQIVANPAKNTTKTGNAPSIGLPPICSSRSRTSIRSEMRRKSMSAFDAERYKIDSEITWLRDKLKNVQEGREKLKVSKGNKERENVELQILEDITSQIQEIRQLTDPKAPRRASLPPLTSNVMSKKRRGRSGPLLLEGST